MLIIINWLWKVYNVTDILLYMIEDAAFVQRVLKVLNLKTINKMERKALRTMQPSETCLKYDTRP